MYNNPIQNKEKANRKDRSGFLGLLMLDTAFPRYRGDIGNPDTFDFPVRQAIISGAIPEKIVRQKPDAFLQPFVRAAIELETQGARLISTSCGFLTLFQAQLQRAVSVPVLTSSLFLHKTLSLRFKDSGHVGILTISHSSLTGDHLAAAGIAANVPIGSTEDGNIFTEAILQNRPQFDFHKAEKDNVDAAKQLVNAHPHTAAILLECTNMPPYADAISAATGLPVYSILDGLNAFWTGSPQYLTQLPASAHDFPDTA